MLNKNFQCGNCAELHDTESNAYSCCEPEIHIVYICEFCEGEFERDTSICECTDAEVNLYPPQKFLESAGQERLFK